MDVPRKDASRNRMIRRIIYAVIVICTIPLITMGYMRLKPAAPPVERATVWIDSVKRGPMVMQRRGIGTLKPEEVLFIPAATDGRVDKILLRPGTTVTADSVLLELSNPELQLAAVDLEWQVKAAEASLVDLRVRLATQRLDLKSNAAHVKSDFNQAKLKAEVEQKLAESGLTSDINIRIAKETANDLAARTQIEEERVAISGESMQAQLDAQKVQIEKLRAAYVLKKKQVDELKVRAGAAGVLQELPVEVGQRLTPGTLLAKVAQPWKLKAVLQIPETQAKDIAIGQKAEIDTRNGIILGKVIRIDPAVINGTRTVDVKLEGELPGGAVPDLSVDGTIELERLNDVLYVGRPVFGQPNSLVTVF
jgi:HlyD family secretion protein